MYLSESNYGGTAFLNKTRKRGSDGRWGLGSAYTFRSFIYDPEVLATFLPVPVAKDEWVDQAEVIKETLRVRVAPSTSAVIINLCPMGFFNVLNTKVAGGYTWYEVAEGAWIAGVEGSVEFHKAREFVLPVPVEKNTKLNQVYVGDVSLRVRAEANTTSRVQGMIAKESYYNVEEVRIESDYTWYKLKDFAFIAGVDKVVYYPAVKEPTLEELKQTVAELEKTVKTLTEENKTLNSTITKLNKDIKAKNTEIANKDKEIVDLTNQVEAQKQDLSNAKTSLEKAEKALVTASGKLSSVSDLATQILNVIK